MKKEDIKKDPIRDSVLNTLSNISDNPKQFINYSAAVTAALLFIIIYFNSNSNKLKDYNLEVSVNQNRYIDSDIDLAVSNFQNILDNYSSSESSNQAFIYLMNDAIEKNDLVALGNLIDNHSFDSTDNTLQSLVYNSYANYYLSSKDFNQAEDYYLKAIKFSDNEEHINNFNLNLLYLYKDQGNKSKALNLMSAIDVENITPYQLKSKYEQLKNSLN